MKNYDVYCPEGHQVWGGENAPPSDHQHYCNECEEEEAREYQQEDYTLTIREVGKEVLGLCAHGWIPECQPRCYGCRADKAESALLDIQALVDEQRSSLIGSGMYPAETWFDALRALHARIERWTKPKEAK